MPRNLYKEYLKKSYILVPGLIKATSKMSNSKMRIKSEIHAGNINKRGKVKPSLRKANASAYPAGPILLGFLIFIVIGSAVFQLFKANLF